MKQGILPYLQDLARRYADVARECRDARTRDQLQSLSRELSNKAHELGLAFVVADRDKTRLRSAR